MVLVDGGSAINKYYKPEYFDTLTKNWFPMAPFWSGLMFGIRHFFIKHDLHLCSLIGSLQRHKQEISNGKQVLYHYNLSMSF